MLCLGSYAPDLARVLTSAATGTAQTASTAAPFAASDILSGARLDAARLADGPQPRRKPVILEENYPHLATPITSCYARASYRQRASC
jgi:hypothetical protein